MAPRSNVPTMGYIEELGPILTLIWGSSVITVINISVEDKPVTGVTVGCWARTTVEADAKKNAQIKNRAKGMAMIVG